MKCPRPGQQLGFGTADCSTTLARDEDLLRAAGHFERGAAGKGQQQQTTRIGASEDQPSHPVRQRLGFAGAGPRSDQQRRRPFLCVDTIGSSAALRRVQALEKRTYGPRGGDSVPFLFHRNRITSRVRPRNPARSRQTKASVLAITDVGRAGRRRESLDAPTEHARRPHTGAEHLRSNASVSGDLWGTEGSNPSPSSGESAANSDRARRDPPMKVTAASVIAG